MAERKYYVLCGSNCKFESMTKEQILTAIQQAVSTGEIADVDTGFITTIKEQNRGNALTFWVGTTAQYNAITEKAEDCFYILTDDTKDKDTAAAIAELRTEIENVVEMVSKQPPYYVTFSGRISPDGADKTFEEIYNAIIEGKRVVGRFPWDSNGFEYYQLIRYTNTVLSFAHINNMSFGTILTDQCKAQFIQMNSDGTLKDYSFRFPEKVSAKGYVSASEVVSIDEVYTDFFTIDDDASSVHIYGNQVSAKIVIKPADDEIAQIKSITGTTTMKELYASPFIVTKEGYNPVSPTRNIVCSVICKEVFNNYDSFSEHLIPCEIDWDDETKETRIYPTTGYITTSTAKSVDSYIFMLSWLIEE